MGSFLVAMSEEPTGKINSPEDLQMFLQSAVFEEFMAFLQLLNESVVQKKLSDPCLRSPVSLDSLSPFCAVLRGGEGG